MHPVILAILWIGWCAMHSILIDASFARMVKARWPQLIPAYRLIYNGLSLVILLPLVGYTSRIGGAVIFAWQGWGGISLRILFLICALLLFWGGSLRYDFKSFLGITQFKAGKSHVLLSTTQDFLPNGVFNMTRHPWYLGSLLAIWTLYSEYAQPIFIAAAILSVYLVVGTLLEERKIVREYGEPYRRYQQQVSMLFPWKWLKGRLNG